MRMRRATMTRRRVSVGANVAEPSGKSSLMTRIST
jgi:hypothetical protein